MSFTVQSFVVYFKDMRLYTLPLLLLALCILLLFDVAVNSNDNYGAYRVDVSWPNCKHNFGNYDQGIIGVTGGLDFHANKCLSRETGNFIGYQLYENTGYPGPAIHKRLQVQPIKCPPKNLNCMAYDYGYNASLYAIRQADLNDAHSNVWWLDVETENSWSQYPSVNIDNLMGAEQAIKDNVFLGKVGFYSYPGQWKIITGGWKNHRPAWVATGSSNVGKAFEACTKPTFTGGQAVLSQFTYGLDINVSCRQPEPAEHIYQNSIN